MGRQGRQGGGGALYVRERLRCTALAIRDDVENLWVTVKGMDSKADVYCWSSSQDNSTEELFNRQV